MSNSEEIQERVVHERISYLQRVVQWCRKGSNFVVVGYWRKYLTLIDLCYVQGKYGDIPCNKWFHNWRAYLFCCSFGLLVKGNYTATNCTCMYVITRFWILNIFLCVCFMSAFRIRTETWTSQVWRVAGGPVLWWESVMVIFSCFFSYTQWIFEHTLSVTNLHQTLLHKTPAMWANLRNNLFTKKVFQLRR